MSASLKASRAVLHLPKKLTMLPRRSPFAMFFLLLAFYGCSLAMSQSEASQQISLPGCPSTCGDLPIPYPFGIGTNCARKGFDLKCNLSSVPQKAYLGSGLDLELLNISLVEGNARVNYKRSYDCYSKNGSASQRANNYLWAGNESAPYFFSSLHNKFTLIGCDSSAFISLSDSDKFMGGCRSVCDNLEKVVNGSCSGIGCCQTPIPKGCKYFEIDVISFYNHTLVWDFNPRSYVFLVDEDWFTFNVEDMTNMSVYRSAFEQVPVVLDWVAGNESCATASRDKDRYACRSEHSECYESSSAAGYICNCSRGYQGNPYLVGGCQGFG